MDFTKLYDLLEKLTSEAIIPCISMAIGFHGKMVWSGAFGEIPAQEGERALPVTSGTRFDIASITKIVAGLCFMKLTEQGLVSLSDPICRLFPAFDTVKPIMKGDEVIGHADASQITWRHCLTHTTGMGWTRPVTIPTLPHLAEGLEDIFALPLACAPGEHVIYSDIPIILMGKAVEMLTGLPLDEAVLSMVCRPLGLTRTGYLRRSVPSLSPVVTAPTEVDAVFRHRRIRGEVHDENAWLLDGVAGHAGIFSTAQDLCALALDYAACLEGKGLLLSRQTASMMIQEQARDDGERRGILWQLSGSGEKAYTGCLSRRAYGHAGFTGCFLWNDPDRDFSAILLSNDVYSGRANRRLFDWRREIMQLALEAVDL